MWRAAGHQCPSPASGALCKFQSGSWHHHRGTGSDHPDNIFPIQELSQGQLGCLALARGRGELSTSDRLLTKRRAKSAQLLWSTERFVKPSAGICPRPRHRCRELGPVPRKPRGWRSFPDSRFSRGLQHREGRGPRSAMPGPFWEVKKLGLFPQRWEGWGLAGRTRAGSPWAAWLLSRGQLPTLPHPGAL